jgi:murein L,D-transpeptidase YafK
MSITVSSSPASKRFKTQQLAFERVRSAFAEKERVVKRVFSDRRIAYPPSRLFIRVFKLERTVEVWAAESGEASFKLVCEYPVCTNSGVLGPKRRQGDGQVPEGFYHISGFNPLSNYHLSLRVSYPNASDKILGTGDLGGDIFIHGNCVSIGCVPITDDKIRELYVLAVEASSAGQSAIPVHIFPARLTPEGMARLEKRDHSNLAAFWSNLKPGFDYFEAHRKLPKVSIDPQGRYVIRQ